MLRSKGLISERIRKGDEPAMLEVTDLHAYYGKSHVLQGVNLTVGDNQVVSLLGRNGVGRSTTTKAIMGAVRVTGSIRFKGREIAGLPPYEIARRGIGIVPESRAIFPTLTVHENLLIGMKSKNQKGRWSIDATFELFPNLKERARTAAGVLRAVRSRCCRSAARSWGIPTSSWSTSRRKGWRHNWSSKSGCCFSGSRLRAWRFFW